MKKSLLLVALGAASLSLSGCNKAEEAPVDNTAADASAATEAAADASATTEAAADAKPGDNSNDVDRKP